VKRALSLFTAIPPTFSPITMSYEIIQKKRPAFPRSAFLLRNECANQQLQQSPTLPDRSRVGCTKAVHVNCDPVSVYEHEVRIRISNKFGPRFG
jgi:hypothetical protein